MREKKQPKKNHIDTYAVNSGIKFHPKTFWREVVLMPRGGLRYVGM